MLTQTQLSALHRAHRGERMLSAYIDGSAPDPAEQRTWQLQVDRAVKDLRTWLDESPRTERDDFERCASLLQEQLAGFDPSVGAPGWVAFVSCDGVIDAQHVSVPVTTQIVWSDGPCIAPYLKALTQTRAAIVVVADARKADIYRYQFGRIELAETVRTHGIAEPSSNESDTGRDGTHSGARGATGHDAAQQSLLENRDRMLDTAAARAVELAGPDGWILLGGIPRVAAALDVIASAAAPGRVSRFEHLDVHATEAMIAEATSACANTMREKDELERLNTIVDRAESGGLGTLGLVATRNALKAESVHRLLVTRRYMEEHPPEAEEAVRIAFDQSAAVEEVSGPAAELLDARGGVAAELRFNAPGTGRDGPAVDSRAGKRPVRPKRRGRATTE